MSSTSTRTTRQRLRWQRCIRTFDLEEVVADAHAADAYVIGRIVTFQDPIAAIGLPEMAVWDTATNTPYEANGQYFLDPTDPEAQAYAIELATEACGAGVDEIQFDYVRFPDNRRDSARFDQGVSVDVRVATVRDFLGTAVAALHPLGCAVAADIFGFITSAIDDGGIGQQWEELTDVVDVASPMLYPSHYSSGWYGYQTPARSSGPIGGRSARRCPRPPFPGDRRATLAAGLRLHADPGPCPDRRGRVTRSWLDVLERREPGQRGGAHPRSLNPEVEFCRLCPRLVEWRERVAREKRASFHDRGVLGTTSSVLRSGRRPPPRPGLGARGPRRQPDGSGLHGRSLRRVALPGALSRRVLQSAQPPNIATTAWLSTIAW